MILTCFLRVFGRKTVIFIEFYRGNTIKYVESDAITRENKVKETRFRRFTREGSQKQHVSGTHEKRPKPAGDAEHYVKLPACFTR